MKRDHREKPFDESTKLKLDIFANCFNEWFPVFLHNQYTERLYVFDFFAGSGTDGEGSYGSPLKLLETARGKDKQYCNDQKANRVSFTFNDADPKKSIKLQENVNQFIDNCRKKHDCLKCVYKTDTKQEEFQTMLRNDAVQNILLNDRYGKFVLIDQFGFKEVNDKVFLKLIGFPKTDFIFFISSSFIRRFKEMECVRKSLGPKIDGIDWSNPRKCHQVIADFYRSLIPDDREYYIHNFSIRKDDRHNIYGLILGSSHTYGMEKFLNVCWKHDKFSGESNYNI